MKPNENKAFVKGLRDLADWYENHPEVPLPIWDTANVFVHSAAALADCARALGKAIKETNRNWLYVKREFGAISLEFNVARSEVCERVVVGVQEIPEQIIPAHTEEIVEWKCPESLLAKGDPR